MEKGLKNSILTENPQSQIAEILYRADAMA